MNDPTRVLDRGYLLSGLALWGRRLAVPHRWLVGVGYLVVYVALDWISYDYDSFAPVGVTPWNPPPGISLVLLLRGGLGYAPWLFVAAAIADVVVRGLWTWHRVIGAALLITLVYSAMAWLLRRLDLDIALTRLRDVTILLVAAIGASCLVSLYLIGLFIVEGQIDDRHALSAMLRYWAGDASGILVTTPALLRFANLTWPQVKARLAAADLEAALQAVALILVLWLVFGLESADKFKFFYVILLPIMWIALRHGLDAACLASLVAQIGLIVLARYRDFTLDVITEFHVLTLLPTVTGLVIGAISEERFAADAERLAAEEALRRQQATLAHVSRVSIAGEMVSALTHELSQPLVATEAYIAEGQHLIELGAEPVAIAEPFALAAGQARRAGEVLARLRKFLYRGEMTMARVSVQAVLAEAVALVQGEARRNNIQIEQKLEPFPVMILADSVQIQQVVINLVRNAIEAMIETTPLDRHIEIRQTSTSGSVEIAVIDTGPGPSPDIEGRLFDAFATTKPHGMGLGLGISRSILEAHRGSLRWERQGARATCFMMTLPRANDDTE